MGQDLLVLLRQFCDLIGGLVNDKTFPQLAAVVVLNSDCTEKTQISFLDQLLDLIGDFILPEVVQ